MAKNKQGRINDPSALKCKKCGKFYSLSKLGDNHIWWDEGGFNYSTKVADCPNCGCPNVIRYVNDFNNGQTVDARLYDYSKRSY